MARLPRQIASIHLIISASNKGGSIGTQLDHQYGNFLGPSPAVDRVKGD
jgi:ribosomal protein L16 Arg81 hydroxylase